MQLIRIATRNSPLALWQANYVKQRLTDLELELTIEIVSMTTKGDQLLDRSLATVGGKGLFLKELEVSLLDGKTDIAVHSMKDVPVSLPEGLEIAVVCEREDARDAFVSNHYQNLYALTKGSRVGTSSLRRVAQLKSAFPDLEFIELRGNVNTRLRKLDQGDYDAIILAAAGLIRLGMKDRIKQYISPELCLPAVGQGVVGIECRSDDENTKTIIKALHSQTSAVAIAAERAMNAKLEGGCQLPIAGYAEIDKGKVRMRGMVAAVDGSQSLFSDITIKSMTLGNAVKLGKNIAKDLLNQGAGDILESLYAEPVKLTKLQRSVVILTREKKYLGNTRPLLKSLDYRSIHVTSLVTVPKYDDRIFRTLANLGQFTDILFVSRNAVEIALPMIQEQQGLPESIRVMAVGSETAKQLYQNGIDALFPDHGTGAKALLKVEQLQELSGRKVLIIRGKIGLDWPAEEMQRRGAEVHSLRCYEQTKPNDLEDQISALFSANIDDRIKGVFVHSSLSVRNLVPYLLQYPHRIKETKLIVGSQQIANAAQECGWMNEIRIAESPSNKHMMIAFSG